MLLTYTIEKNISCDGVSLPVSKFDLNYRKNYYSYDSFPIEGISLKFGEHSIDKCFFKKAIIEINYNDHNNYIEYLKLVLELDECNPNHMSVFEYDSSYLKVNVFHGILEKSEKVKMQVNGKTVICNNIEYYEPISLGHSCNIRGAIFDKENKTISFKTFDRKVLERIVY